MPASALRAGRSWLPPASSFYDSVQVRPVRGALVVVGEEAHPEDMQGFQYQPKLSTGFAALDLVYPESADTDSLGQGLLAEALGAPVFPDECPKISAVAQGYGHIRVHFQDKT